jgi:hypothetical protein
MRMERLVAIQPLSIALDQQNRGERDSLGPGRAGQDDQRMER